MLGFLITLHTSRARPAPVPLRPIYFSLDPDPPARMMQESPAAGAQEQEHGKDVRRATGVWNDRGR
jgi:hypothetical protein